MKRNFASPRGRLGVSAAESCTCEIDAVQLVNCISLYSIEDAMSWQADRRAGGRATAAVTGHFPRTSFGHLPVPG